MRGLDAWLSKGHERLDDDPEPAHPLDVHEDPCVCAHGLTIEQFCPDCAVMAETALAVATAKALERIRQTEDEAMGTFLEARGDYESG